MYDFAFNGVTGRSMGVLVIAPIPIIKPAEKVELKEVPGRSGFITYREGAYESFDLPIECAIDGLDDTDLNQKARILNNWLKRGLGRLTVSNQPDRSYEAIMANKIEITPEILALGQFLLLFRCKPLAKAGDEVPLEFDFTLPFTPTWSGELVIDDQDTANITYEGFWGEAPFNGAVNDSIYYSSSSEAAYQIPFTGNYFRISAVVNNWYTTADVFLDGVKVGQMDLYSEAAGIMDVFEKSDFEYGPHTLRVEHSGADGSAISLDAIIFKTYDLEEGRGTFDFTVENLGDLDSKPEFQITSRSDFSIRSLTTGEVMTYHGIPEGVVTIDSENMEVHIDGDLKNTLTEGSFITLKPGVNNIRIEGKVTHVKVTPNSYLI